jgi:hypothetical protein
MDYRKNLGPNANNASISTQLLVIWILDNDYNFDVQVLLIKHDNTFT